MLGPIGQALWPGQLPSLLASPDALPCSPCADCPLVRAMYRSLFADLMASLSGISVPPLRLDAAAGMAGDLSRFAGIYAWPDRQVEVTATANGLLINSQDGQTEALPLDDRTFVADPADPDNPTVTFGAFDAAGRPRMLYDMLWGLPRLDR
jgi:hypothetical protein